MARKVIPLLLLALLLISPARALEAGSDRLIEEAGALDGQEIVLMGEVIGDILGAGDHVWLNVSDGRTAVGAWTPRVLALEVRVPGRYAQRGDTVRVTGVFHRACPEHGGDLDVHASRVELLRRGYPTLHPVPRWKPAAAAVLLAFALCAMAFTFLKSLRRTDRGAGLRGGPTIP